MWDDYRLAGGLDIENEAKTVASQVAVQVLDTYPDSCNFDKEIAEIFEKCLRDIAVQIRETTQKKERLERRFKVICKRPVDDFISINIERTINARDIQIRQQKLNMDIHKKAYELLSGYKFDTGRLADKMEKAPSFQTSGGANIIMNTG
jgi:hypothetical protein